MLDTHSTKLMFADLDPLQQEKTVRAYEIFFDILNTDYKNKKNKSLITQASGPTCGCIIDGFKKMTGEMKCKINLCHLIVAGHIPLF